MKRESWKETKDFEKREMKWTYLCVGGWLKENNIKNQWERERERNEGEKEKKRKL